MISYPDGAVVTREYGARGELLKWTDSEEETGRFQGCPKGKKGQELDINNVETMKLLEVL